MRIKRGWNGIATAVLLLAVASACTDGSSTDPPPGTVSSPSPSGTPSPSPQDLATDAATETLRTFYVVRDGLRKDPKQPVTKLATVAISTELTAQEALFKRERHDGLRQIGDTKIAELKVQSVSLDNSDPKAGRVPTVQIDVCFDVSNVDIVDKTGSSVVSDDRADTGWIRYSVSNYKWDTNPTGAWRVASSENIERAPCAAS